MPDATTFQPNWVSSPGETITRVLTVRGLSLTDLAHKIDAPLNVVDDLVRGAASIDEPLAERLAYALGTSARFWLNRERQYRADVKRLRMTSGDCAVVDRDWLREMPVRDMAKFGWIKPGQKPAETTDALLRFFGVPDVASWRAKYRAELAVAAFRTSLTFASNPASVAAWLRWAEIKGEGTVCAPWDPAKFTNMLGAIRTLTRHKDPAKFVPELRRLCAVCGVALVIAPVPKGCRASGATRFLSPTKALIVLSFRYRSDDHFWFTFFHEAGHLLLHGKDALFLEDEDEPSSDEEAEANEFAARMLIPQTFMPEFLRLRPRTREVLRFAVRAGISPGVVVGQLQHAGRIGHNQLNSLKRRYTWVDFAADKLSP